MNYFLISALVFLSENVLSMFTNIRSQINNIPEDAKLNFMQLSIKYGYPAEEHYIITEDGYNLTVFRIPGKGCPVFLQHGIVDSADTFILRGLGSPALVLAKEGYDVWLGNMRGGRHSRRHVRLDPDTDRQYWNFSMHEIATYDLPAMIDYILDKTNYKQVLAIGHSQGNAIFYALGASKQEYNAKIKVLVALAPICYLHHVRPPNNILVFFSELINIILLVKGQEEVLNDNSILIKIIKWACSEIPLNYEICAYGGFFLFAGLDPIEFEKSFMEVVSWHYPTSTSRTNALHMSQIARSKRFQRFDFGIAKNMEMYGSAIPPEYDLSRVTMRVELFMGGNDKLSTIEDVSILRKKLPNANYTLMTNPKMNHFDFLWGLHMNKYLFPELLKVLGNACR